MDFALAIVFAAIGMAAGYGLWTFFRRMPTRWLLDYGETIISDELLAVQHLPWKPDGLVIAGAAGLSFALAWLDSGWSLQLAVTLLAVLPLILIMVADQKTRIIPDQFTAALVILAIVAWLVGLAEGQSFWMSLLWRLAAGLVSGGLLLGAGLLGGLWLKREAMGMGDVKLLAACGLLAGWSNVLPLIILSFVTASIFAVPQLIRLRLASHQQPAGENQAETDWQPEHPTDQQGLTGLEDQADLAQPDTDDLEHPELADDAIAFGPFIALATLIVLLLDKPIHDLWQAYLGLLT